MVMSSNKATVYMTDYGSNTIRKMDVASRLVTTIAGKAGVSGSADGTGTAATFYSPHDITTDGTHLYVTDTGNNTIRKITIATNEVITLAGKAGTAGTADGTGTAATFNGPLGITISGTTLYVTDANSNTIRQIDSSAGTVTTIAGSAGSSGSANGTGTAATFDAPAGITTDGTNLYVCDFYNNMIRKIVISSKVVTTLAGSTSYYGSADGSGASASFYSPNGITTDGTNLYVTDSNNALVRKIVISTGTVTTVAGLAATTGSSDGSASVARFYFPVGITYDSTNSSLYVADASNHTIRMIQ
jgi:DNA-binding beta-propeller fold protein YncE